MSAKDLLFAESARGKILPLEVKIGDKVLFSKYSGTELKLDGAEYLMMREEDIVGVFN